MHRYLIERDLPGAGSLTQEQLQGISETSCGVLNEMGSGIQWVQSYVTNDRITCVYLAESEEAVREHAKRGGFPCTKVSEIKHLIDPMTAVVS